MHAGRGVTTLKDEAVLFPAPKGSLISRKGQTPEGNSPDRAREPPSSSSVILYRRVWLFTLSSCGASTQHLWQKEAFHNLPFLIFISVLLKLTLKSGCVTFDITLFTTVLESFGLIFPLGA